MNKITTTALIVGLAAIITFASMAATASATTYAVTLTGPAKVYEGLPIVVSGTYSEDSVPKEGVTVNVYDVTSGDNFCTECHTGGGGSQVGSGTTLADGTYSIDIGGPYAVGTYKFAATTGSDASRAQSQPFTVQVIAGPPQPPTANAGPDQSVHAGTLVTLDGSASTDTDGSVQGYAWTLVSFLGSSPVLSDAHAVNPMFTASSVGEYVFELKVTDDAGAQSPNADQVKITATNNPPTAGAGSSQNAIVRSTVTLDGSKSSDQDADPLTYAWSTISTPDRSTLQFSSTAQKPTFTPDLAGTYKFQLIVNDGFSNSAPSTVTITVTSSKTTVVQDLQNVQATVVKLDSSNFINKNAQKGLTNDLFSAIKAVDAGQYQKAVDQLRTTLKKTDGCAITGSPDKSDVIKNCDAQGQIYPDLVNVIKEINTLQTP